MDVELLNHRVHRTLQRAYQLSTRQFVVLKTALIDFYFILALFLFLRIIWRLVELADQLISQKVIQTGRDDELAPLIKLLVLIERIFLGNISI